MSEYHISRITKKGVDSIASMLVPEIVSAIKDDMPVTAFAVVDDKVAVGALGGVVDRNAFEIISIFVAPQDRRKGAGTALMEALFKLCEGEELEVRAEYTPLDEEGRTLEPFFEAMGLGQESVTFPTYCVNDLSNVGIDSRSLTGSMSDIIALSDAPAGIIDEISKNGENEAGMLRDLRSSISTADKNLSFIATSKGRIKACVLTEHLGESLLQITPVWGMEDDVPDMKLMISYVFEEFKNTGEQAVSVIIPVLDPATQSIVEDIRGMTSPATLSFVKKNFAQI